LCLKPLAMRKFACLVAMSCLFLPALAHPSYQSQRKLGDQALARRNYTAAIKAFESLVQSYPRRFEARQALGFALFQSGQLDRAADQFRKALTLAPKQPSLQRDLILVTDRQAIAKAQELAFPEAQALLAATERRFASSKAALVLQYRRGQLQFFAGNPGAGVELWKDVASRMPDSGTARFLAGYAANQAGQLDKAQQMYEAAARKLKDDPVVLNSYGLVLADQGHLDEASAQFAAAAAKAPPYANLYLNYARLLERQGLLDQAAVQIKHLATFPAARAQAHLWLAALAGAQGSPVEPELIQAGVGGPDSVLLVSSVQSGWDVWLDQTYLGPTPVGARITAGFHRIKIQPVGRQPSVREFDVQPGQICSASADQFIELQQRPLIVEKR
jgi:tetratricopeptide (TPR) repeat protein